MENLRYYQKEAVENIYEFFKSDKCKAKMYISTGLGKTVIIAAVIQIILKNNNASILILSSRSMLCEQIKIVLLQMIEYVNIATHVRELKEQKILITTYQAVSYTHLKGLILGLQMGFCVVNDISGQPQLLGNGKGIALAGNTDE